MYDDNWKEQLIESRVQPHGKRTHEVYFNQKFFFVRSDNNMRLKAEANGIIADIFEGCLFKAKEGRLILVNISSGKTSVDSYLYMRRTNELLHQNCQLCITIVSFPSTLP